MADVSVQITGDASKAEQDFTKLEKRIEALEAKLKKAGNASKSANNDIKSSFSDMLSSLASTATAVTIVGGTVRTLEAAHQQVNAEAREYEKIMDRVARQFRVESGLRGLQAESAQQAIGDIATDLAVPEAKATEAAAALVSRGFSTTEATGDSLRSVLAGGSAEEGAPGLSQFDAAKFSEQIAEAIERGGLEKTGKNVQDIVIAKERLDLEKLPTLARMDKVSVIEQLALADLVTDRGGSGDAAIATLEKLFIGVNKRDEKQLQALGGIGLKPEDVDLDGETLAQVLETIGSRTDKLPESERHDVLRGLVGDKQLLSLEEILRNRSGFAENLKAAVDVEGFNSALSESTSGPLAADIRMENQWQAKVRPKYNQSDRLMRAAELDALENGSDPEGARFGTLVARGFDAIPQVSPETGLRFAFGGGILAGEDAAEKAHERIRQNSGPASGLESQRRDQQLMQENNQLLQDIRGALLNGHRGPRTLNPKAHRESGR